MALTGCNSENQGTATTTTPLAAEKTYYQTKTPYQPQQDLKSYEAAPAGFAPVYTEMVARHGSRGLSSLKYDLAVYNMWKQAKADHALTPLGERLGPDVLAIMKANFLLGYGIKGISQPGYGNETQTGIQEHQQLAARLLKRLPEYFTQVGQQQQRKITVITSGVDRAVDSGYFFTQSLLSQQPNLTTLVTYPKAPAPYPASQPVAKPDGTNRFLLYFHKLDAANDLVTSSTDPYYATYQASQAYQAYEKDNDLKSKLNELEQGQESESIALEVLNPLFKPEFIQKIKTGQYRFSNSGTMSFKTDDGKFENTLTGNGKEKIESAQQAAALLYELYSIVPNMASEVKVNFIQYMPAKAAQYYAALNDAKDFYEKGPGIAEKGDVTYRMARLLRDDFFQQVDRIAAGDLSQAATLRFAHAEIMIPLASSFGLKQAAQPVPVRQTYHYDTNPWRGVDISPMAANMQWDVYKNAQGIILVKMLYNEKESDFKPACDQAKWQRNSHFYDYQKLKACYAD